MKSADAFKKVLHVNVLSVAHNAQIGAVILTPVLCNCKYKCINSPPVYHWEHCCDELT